MESITKFGKREILAVRAFGDNPEGSDLISFGVITSRMPKDKDIIRTLGKIQIGKQLSTIVDGETNETQEVTVIGFRIARK